MNKYSNYKYIYPPAARYQEQLDIMMRDEAAGIDPIALENIDQEKQKVILVGEYWFVAENRYPREGSEKHLLIIANKPMYTVDEITPEAWAELLEVWKKVIAEQELEGGGFCLRFGDPEKSGASLKRLHVNVLVPKEGEKVRFPIGGRKELKEGLVIEK